MTTFPVLIKGGVYIEASSETEAESKVNKILYECFFLSDVKIGFEVSLMQKFEIIGLIGLFATIGILIWMIITLAITAGV